MQLHDSMSKISGHHAMFSFRGFVILAADLESYKPLWGIKIGKFSRHNLLSYKPVVFNVPEGECSKLQSSDEFPVMYSMLSFHISFFISCTQPI